jgi:hypothetical protein
MVGDENPSNLNSTTTKSYLLKNELSRQLMMEEIENDSSVLDLTKILYSSLIKTSNSNLRDVLHIYKCFLDHVRLYSVGISCTRI